MHSDQNVVSEEISNATQQAEIDLNIEKETTETNKDDNLIQKFNANTAVDDFIFMCFLVGNDFVPNIPSLAILDNGIESMIDVYKNVGKYYGHLTRISRKSKDITVMFQQKKH